MNPFDLTTAVYRSKTRVRALLSIILYAYMYNRKSVKHRIQASIIVVHAYRMVCIYTLVRWFASLVALLFRLLPQQPSPNPKVGSLSDWCRKQGHILRHLFPLNYPRAYYVSPCLAREHNPHVVLISESLRGLHSWPGVTFSNPGVATKNPLGVWLRRSQQFCLRRMTGAAYKKIVVDSGITGVHSKC